MRNAVMIISVALMLALMTACMPAVRTYVCPDGSQVSDPAMCVKETGETPADTVKTTQVTKPAAPEEPETEAEPEPETIPLEEKQLSAKALDLFDKSAKVKTVTFNYFHSDDPYTDNKYYASRDYMKIEIVNKVKYDKDEPYDTKYVNFLMQTAAGYCESSSQGVCPDRNKKYPLDFAETKIPTPFTWIDMIESADLTGRSKQIESRASKEVTFTLAGKSGVLWADSFFGIPIEIEYDGVSYKYQNLGINTADDEDLVHQILENV